MHNVYEHIGRRSEQFAAQPLFSYLRSGDIDAARRLQFVPCMTHFVMTFADLYNVVLPETSPSDRYQELVNAHLGEDAGHWRWFLADLSNAKLDPELRYTDALRFIWSADTVETRRLSYGMCQLSGGLKSSIEKLVMVNCIEATGKIALSAFAVAGLRLERDLGRKLVYFGAHHVDTEAGHTLEAIDVRQSIERVILSAEERRSSMDLVDKTFALFERSVQEMYSIAQKGVTLPGVSHPSTSVASDTNRRPE